MLILPIEKEIESEHKIIGRFNIRQAICGGGIIASVVLLYMTLNDLFWTILCVLPFLAIFGVAGWYTKNGLYAEDVLIKMLQQKYYKNTTRKYRTKNYYFRLFNRAGAKQKTQAATSKQQKNKGKRGKK